MIIREIPIACSQQRDKGGGLAASAIPGDQDAATILLQSGRMNSVEPSASQKFDQGQMEQVFDQTRGHRLRPYEIALSSTMHRINDQHSNIVKVSNQPPAIMKDLIRQIGCRSICIGSQAT